MNGFNLTRPQGATQSILALLASSAILTAGCANMVSTAPAANSLNSGASVTGRVHGGNQPVAGATVTVNFAGESGLRSASTVAATTTTAADGTGSFSFTVDPVNGNAHPSSGSTFSCPSSGDPVVYVVARGGNTLNNGNTSLNNTAAVFLSPIGLCSTLTSGTSQVLNLSEVTTVASIAALQQYFDPITESIGHDGIGAAKQALVNSVSLVSNLVDLTHGTAYTTVNRTGASTGDGVATVTVTATPEVAKINHIANIISSCVNNGSAGASNCNTLFANATPPNPSFTGRPSNYVFPVATDVLQAAFYMLANPTDGSTTNLTNLYNLSPAVGAPYNPALTAVPSDWTIAVNYSTTSTCGTGSGAFINAPKDINVDINGGIWFANGQAGTGNLAGFSANGTPQSCVFLSGGSQGGGVLDDQGKVWFGGTANNLYRYDPVGHTTLTFPTTDAPLAIVADGNHNVYFSTATTGALFMIPGASTATAAVAPVQISSSILTANRLFVDNSATGGGAIWATSGSSSFAKVALASSGPNMLNGYNTTIFFTTAPTYGIAVDLVTGSPQTNNVYVSVQGSDNYITKWNGSGTTYAPVNGWPTPSGLGGLNTPTSIVLDGSVNFSPTNIWGVNNAVNSTSGLYGLTEISPTQVALSPTGTAAGGFQKASPYLGPGRALAIDQSGNLWIANDGATSITEIVGSAVPLYQPYAIGLMNGRFQTIP